MGQADETRRVMRKHGIRPKKKYGQNFLIHEGILDEILDVADVTGEDYVLEIGPGLGNMTKKLCKIAKKVVAVEIDKDLIPVLKENLQDRPNFQVLEGDILKQDLRKISAESMDHHPMKVVANLPYYVTTPIVMKLLEDLDPVQEMVVMMQKEVAERMVAEPGTKECGAISLAVQYYARPTIETLVPPSSFIPQPKVDSVVMKLVKRETPPVVVKDEKLLFSLIKASFAQRRKTLVNGISGSGELDYTKEEVIRALRAIHLDERIRGEKLGLAEFGKLADQLKDMKEER